MAQGNNSGEKELSQKLMEEQGKMAQGNNSGEKELDGIVAFLHAVGKLKREKRRGWVEKGVKDAESVAEHCFRLAVMTLLFSKKLGLDECRALKLAIVHDLPESIAGDTAVRVREELQKIPNAEKREREENALNELCGMLGPGNARELRELWLEFEGKKSTEAELVYELDRLEALFQAGEYERQGNFRASLQEFYDYADARVKIPELRRVFEKLIEGRKAMPADA